MISVSFANWCANGKALLCQTCIWDASEDRNCAVRVLV